MEGAKEGRGRGERTSEPEYDLFMGETDLIVLLEDLRETAEVHDGEVLKHEEVLVQLEARCHKHLERRRECR